MQMRSLSLTIENITESAVIAIAAQQKSLYSLAKVVEVFFPKVVLNNRIALDYLLAEE